ncbi:GL15755 [Drosophila persimilis]|uniref:Regulatory protein zeste n=1 Tax=Drosophila persimilis TaxID=7234 RepID=B4GQ56_DROPE|nr:GL15755 [Drosophila persimilis]
MERMLKRSRGKNFSEAEVRILFQLVDNHKDVLLNKKSYTATWKLKSETWVKIAEEYCTQSGVARTWVALRDKYTNANRKERRCHADLSLSSGSHNQAPSQHQYEANYSESTQEGRNNLWKEKFSLIKLQRDYIRDENTRLAETHRIEMEKQQLELQHLRLKNQLLELEIEELKKRG